ncbi:hypothetical protein LCGC14_2624410 [marine sediment metagenome]|uniref:FCP1 homology domain-containing protein n=1 Tax=marine sediment metagenome TaxID=412755 RepID=A0A0F9A296_9ZZZZ
MRAVLDFDNTVRNWETGEPEPGVREAIERLRKKGYYISILSCRTGKEWVGKRNEKMMQKKFIEDFMKEYEIPFDEVLDYDKPIADVYIDDAGIEYKNNWEEIADRLAGDE